MSVFYQHTLTIDTNGRGTLDITARIEAFVKKSQLDIGICHLFIKHTSASLIICENADPQVRKDLENYLVRLIPDGDPLFLHNDEGKDDMPAHVRTVLTQTQLSIPISKGSLALGTWQGIYLYEHRLAPHSREIVVTLNGRQL
jgi:secondary thiamine-phosphate synthase enzyme